jgi:hypothetical protein
LQFIKALLGLYLFRPCLGLFTFLGYSYYCPGLNPAGSKERAQDKPIKPG